MSFWNRRRGAPAAELLPVHVGIIMDGNGRWAKRRGLPRKEGHRQGAKTFRKIAEYANQIGIRYLTVYAFSTENWKRPKEEVDSIMQLLREYLREIERYAEENVRLRFLGDRSALDADIRELMERAEAGSRDHTGMTLNIAINYGGRDELTRAVKSLAQSCIKGELSPGDIDYAQIAARLDTAGQPDPDLIIRPSGEQRISNFLICQSAYAEFLYMKVLWPDFTPRHFDRALWMYSRRSRRFGGLSA